MSDLAEFYESLAAEKRGRFALELLWMPLASGPVLCVCEYHPAVSRPGYFAAAFTKTTPFVNWLEERKERSP